MKNGFTLIELSIVLVIIGLVTGGITLGRHLIRSAELKALVSSIREYETALNAFKLKYNEIPGDLPADMASSLNWNARSGADGCGDGDGKLEGVVGYPTRVGGCEATLFWSDLADAGFISGNYDTANGSDPPSSQVDSGFDDYYPPSKYGAGTNVVAWGGSKILGGNGMVKDKTITLSILRIKHIRTDGFIKTGRTSMSYMPVHDMHGVDVKIDDGLPITGKVVAQYLTFSNAPAYLDIDRNTVPSAGSTPLTSWRCFDNDGSVGTPYHYSLENGDSRNCIISFRIRK